uniref:40S ribosomal protein S3a n=1 Tax=Xenopus tropicalis TaxID=8364 RepID=A0A5S6LFL6_XENTR|eukprot:XP_017945921.1 PREDICTED: large neutral amino acids transporter small subunit 4-like isoform X1 [Xenopus tropicalis]
MKAIGTYSYSDIVSFQLPLYIGNNEWLYSSMVMGCFTASATVFTLMKVAYNAGVPFVPLLVGYGALSCAMFLNGFFCWGLEQNGEEKKSKYSIQLQLTCCGTGQKAAEKSAWDRESLKYKFETSLRDRERILSRRKKLHFKRPEEPSSPLLRSSLLSPVFVLHLLSDSLLQTWLHFYISSLNLWLQSALYSSLFGALQMVGLFSAPLISILLHRQKETNKGATSKGRLLIGFILQILTAAGFGTACLIQSLGVQVPQESLWRSLGNPHLLLRSGNGLPASSIPTPHGAPGRKPFLDTRHVPRLLFLIPLCPTVCLDWAASQETRFPAHHAPAHKGPPQHPHPYMIPNRKPTIEPTHIGAHKKRSHALLVFVYFNKCYRDAFKKHKRKQKTKKNLPTPLSSGPRQDRSPHPFTLPEGLPFAHASGP